MAHPLKGDPDAEELFLVDCGIEDLSEVYLQLPQLLSLNLHSNYIERIENLHHVPNLTHLDLSSNQIIRMEGLNHLPYLKHLNLSCNQLTMVEGLSKLRSLLSLNLSYNQLIDVSGLRHLPENNCLATLQLQGNSLSDMKVLLSVVRVLRCISCLVLEDGPSSSNPVCENQNYSKLLKENILSLKSTEKAHVNDTLLSSEGGKSSLEPSSTTHEDVKAVSRVETPNIDAVLNRFHKALESKSISQPSTDTSTPEPPKDREKQALEEKLADLEKELLQGRIDRMESELNSLKNKPELPEAETPAVHENIRGTRVVARSHQPHTEGSRKQQTSNIPRKAKSSATTVTGKKIQPTSRQVDNLKRDAVSSTYNQIIKDLKTEQERRAKAEEATSKILQQLSQMRTAALDHEQVKRNCDDALRRLQQKVDDHDSVEQSLKDELSSCKDKCNQLQMDLKENKKLCCDQEKALTRSEDMMEQMEKSRDQTDQRLKRERDQLEKALAEQTDVLHIAQMSVRSQKTELEEMRSLLAARESEHRRDLDCRYTLDSPKLEELLSSKVSNLIRNHEQERRQFEDRLEKSGKSYYELEDEFRMALQIEADRFNKLQEGFSTSTEELSSQRQINSSLQAKDSKSVKMIAELTQLVKEQKDKLILLSKEKQDSCSRAQSLKSKLEAQVEDLKGQVKHLDRLKKDNIELKSQVQGQHTVICGLRKERELWGKELAQQGAALSSERGSMEARIESLVQENKTLQTRLNDETDSVKIKTKVISDLTDTVTDLKKRLAETENLLSGQANQLESLKIQHLKELEEERSNSTDLESQVDSLSMRKDELKDRLIKTESELTAVQESHRKLKVKWQEKSSSISGIEDQVKSMQNAWKEKETKLCTERDKAIEAADIAVKKLRSTDDAFRKQLDAKDIAHADKTREIQNQYELRLAESQHQMEQLENEMREILSEKENSKKHFDEKLKRVTRAFMELQNDIQTS